MYQPRTKRKRKIKITKKGHGPRFLFPRSHNRLFAFGLASRFLACHCTPPSCLAYLPLFFTLAPLSSGSPCVLPSTHPTPSLLFFFFCRVFLRKGRIVGGMKDDMMHSTFFASFFLLEGCCWLWCVVQTFVCLPLFPLCPDLFFFSLSSSVNK